MIILVRSVVIAGLFCVTARAADSQFADRIAEALQKSQSNRPQIEMALRKTPASQREGMEFLVAYMPDRDLQSLSADLLLENVDYAYQAWHRAPWRDQVSKELFLNYILPYANVTERRERWRKDFFQRFWPLVRDAKSPAVAGALLNQKIFPLLKVRYSRQRRRADQGPYESIETGTASCTGLSILLIDACRACGIPARFAGTPLWSDRSGNHSWVEIWDGGWHFTGAAEPTGTDLDKGWFVGRAAKAQVDSRLHAIYAVSYRPTPLQFPAVWARTADGIYAVNVTGRYTTTTRQRAPGALEVMFCVIETQLGQRQRWELQLQDAKGKTVFRGTSKDERFDGNDHLVGVIATAGKYTVVARRADAQWSTAVVIDRDGQLLQFDTAGKLTTPGQK